MYRFREHHTAESGFSLVELVTVLLILALAATATATFMRWPLAKAMAENSISRIAEMDSLARAMGHADRDIVLAIDCVKQTIAIKHSSTGSRSTIKMITFDKPILKSVLVQGDSSPRSRAEVAVYRSSITSSYAVKFASPNARQEWICISGFTGQVKRHSESDTEISRLLNR